MVKYLSGLKWFLSSIYVLEYLNSKNARNEKIWVGDLKLRYIKC